MSLSRAKRICTGCTVSSNFISRLTHGWLTPLKHFFVDFFLFLFPLRIESRVLSTTVTWCRKATSLLQLLVIQRRNTRRKYSPNTEAIFLARAAVHHTFIAITIENAHASKKAELGVHLRAPKGEKGSRGNESAPLRRGTA